MSNEKESGIGLQYRTLENGRIEPISVSLVADPLEDCARIMHIDAGKDLEALMKNGVPVPKYPRGKNPHIIHIDDAGFWPDPKSAAVTVSNCNVIPHTIRVDEKGFVRSEIELTPEAKLLMETLERDMPTSVGYHISPELEASLHGIKYLDPDIAEGLKAIIAAPVRARISGLTTEQVKIISENPGDQFTIASTEANALNVVITQRGISLAEEFALKQEQAALNPAPVAKKVLVVGAGSQYLFDRNEMETKLQPAKEVMDDFNTGKTRLAKDEEWTREGNNKKWRRPGIDAQRKKMAKASKKRNRR